MSYEIAATDSLLRELAHLRTDLDGAVSQLRIATAATEAERAARVAAQSELEAARAVVALARAACHAPLFDGRGPLVTAIARYDWTVQEARAE